MKHYIIALCAFFSITTFSQHVDGTVIDDETGDPIPYFNFYVTGKVSDFGNGDGKFTFIKTNLENDSLSFFQDGYEKAKIKVSDLKDGLIIRLKKKSNLRYVKFASSTSERIQSEKTDKIANNSSPEKAENISDQSTSSGDFSTESKSLMDLFQDEVELTQVGTLPTTITNMGYTNDDDHIYIWGGQEKSGLLYNKIHQYVPSKNSWKFLSTTPTLKFNALGIDKKMRRLYTFGGYSSILSLDILNKRLNKKSILNKIFNNAGITSHGSYFYVVGGSENRNYTNSFYRYDARTDSWKNLPRAPAKIVGKAAYYNESVYLFGGRGESYENKVYRFDIAQNRWNTFDEIPFVPLDYAIAQDKNYVFLVGKMGLMNYILTYNLENKKFKGFKINIKTRFSGAAVVQGKLYVFGGQVTNYSNISNEVHAIDVTSLTEGI